MSFLRGFLTTPTEEEKQDGSIATIEKLCDRITSSTLLDDRRDAIRALRALSKSYQVEVGTQAMDLLVSVVREDSSDVEVTEMVLETLLNIMSSEGNYPVETDLGVQFTEIFVKQDVNVTLLLTLLEEYDFHVRWPTVKLLTLLLKNKSKELQECVLVSPMGVSKLMDLLSDSREIIRNDGLLLLIKLTKSNAAIQKIVAFENAFERLLLIVSVEGNSDGGIIVEDCCTLLLNLLRNNISNQNFFRETSNIQRMCPFFEMESPEEGQMEVWTEQKQKNILLMLEILQVLVAPSNNQQSVTSCQKVMYSRGVYMLLMDLMLYPNIPPHIFAKILLTLGDIIRGNAIIQEYMDELEMSDRPAVVLILMFMVNDKQPFTTRMAALYCVQCYLCKNPPGQSSIVSTLLPSLEDAPTSVTSGQLLCAGLFSSDCVAHWLCAVTLGHCLHNNVTQKEAMLHVQLELTPGQPPVLLITQVFSMLVQESSPLTKFGAVILLSLWLEECPASVRSFLQDPRVVPYLLGQIESGAGSEEQLQGSVCGLILGLCLKYNDDSLQQYNRSNLLHLITHRVGIGNFSELLEAAAVSAPFNLASKSAHPTATSQQQLLLDHLFVKFYKKQLDVLCKALEGEEEETESNTIESHDIIVNSYKQLIKDQDEEIQKLRALVSAGQHDEPTTSNPVQSPLVTEGAPAQSAPAPTFEQLEQLQQYIQQQEQYYQQYIQQLQAWYTEQLVSEQASNRQTTSDPITTAQKSPDTMATAQQTSPAPDSMATAQQTIPDTIATAQQTILNTSAAAQQTSSDTNTIATGQQTIQNTMATGQQTIQNTMATAQQTSQDTRTSATSQQTTPNTSAAAQQTTSNTSSITQQTTSNTFSITQQTAPATEPPALQQNLADIQQRLVQLSLKAEQRCQELDSKTNRVSALENQVKNSSIKVEQAEQQLKRFSQQIEQYKSQLASQALDNNDLQQTLTQCQQSNEETVIELRSKIYEQSQIISTQNNEILSRDKANVTEEKKRQDKEELLQKNVVISKLQERIIELENKNTELDGDNNQLKNQNNELETKASSIQNVNNNLECKNSELNNQIRLLENAALETSVTQQNTVPQPSEIPQKLPSGLYFDYSQWFVPVVADDGVTWYTSTDDSGQYYSVEQYEEYVAQNEQYYTEYYASLESQESNQHPQTEGTAETTKILTDLSDTNIELANRNMELTNNNAELANQNVELRSHITDLGCQIDELKLQISEPSEDKSEDKSRDKTRDAESDMTDKERFDSLAIEQDDLLILLAHQDKQIGTLKSRLRALGEEIKSESDTMSDDFDELSDDVPKACELDDDGRPLSVEL